MNDNQCKICLGDGCDIDEGVYCEYCVQNDSLGVHKQKDCEERTSDEEKEENDEE